MPRATGHRSPGLAARDRSHVGSECPSRARDERRPALVDRLTDLGREDARPGIEPELVLACNLFEQGKIPLAQRGRDQVDHLSTARRLLLAACLLGQAREVVCEREEVGHGHHGYDHASESVLQDDLIGQVCARLGDDAGAYARGHLCSGSEGGCMGEVRDGSHALGWTGLTAPRNGE